MIGLSVKRLRTEEIDAAYVLARLGYDGLSCVDWRERAETLLARPEGEGGVLAAYTATGRAVGLLIYQVTPTPSSGPTLQVERIIGFDLTDPESVADALVDDLLRRGRAEGCDSVALIQPISGVRDIAAQIRQSDLSALHRVF